MRLNFSSLSLTGIVDERMYQFMRRKVRIVAEIGFLAWVHVALSCLTIWVVICAQALCSLLSDVLCSQTVAAHLRMMSHEAM